MKSNLAIQDDDLTKQQLFDILKDKWQRMNSLYWIIDKHSKSVLFRMNVAQQTLFENQWHLNVLLKDRQRGCTTLICLLYLDDCLFYDNVEAGIIAHKESDSKKIFRRKVKYPYDNLPDQIKAQKRLMSKRNDELSFPNNSIIFVSTSMRSGTVNRLLLSEFGKVCAKYPEKAKEIVAGSLEAIHIKEHEIVWIESTAEGREGYFYDYCTEAEKARQLKKPLTRMSFKGHFFGWTSDPDKRTEEEIPITKANAKYFENLEKKLNIKLDDEQKWWYCQKALIQRYEMKKENPGTFEEAFEAAIEGAYYQEQIADMYEEGRVKLVPHVEGVKVHTAWDLGWDDSTSIWFYQDVGREIHLIDYHEENHSSLLHYGKLLKKKANENNWVFGLHWGPFDVLKHELGTGKHLATQARELRDPVTGESFAFNFNISPKIKSQAEGIEAVRSVFHRCWFDKINTTQTIKLAGKEREVGLLSIENYRQEFDEKKEKYVDRPLHNWASHGAKSFETMAMAHKSMGTIPNINSMFS